MSFGSGFGSVQNSSCGFGTVSGQVFGGGDTTKGGFKFNNTGKEVQSPKIEPGKEKTETEPALKNSCTECDRYCKNKIEDTRNQHFSELLQDELQYIQPCMRTTVYAKILNFLHFTKKTHFINEVGVAELEKNDEVVVEEENNMS